MSNHSTSARQTRPTVLSKNPASASSPSPSSGRSTTVPRMTTGFPRRTPIAPAPAASTIPNAGSDPLAARARPQKVASSQAPAPGEDRGREAHGEPIENLECLLGEAAELDEFRCTGSAPAPAEKISEPV